MGLDGRVVVTLSCFVAMMMARECFHCTYNYWERDPVTACLDPFDSSLKSPGVTRLTCSGNCIKVRYRRNSTLTRMTRTCVVNTFVLESCLHGCFQSRDYKETCAWCCEEDMCNGAGAVTPGHRLQGACALLLLLIGRLLV